MGALHRRDLLLGTAGVAGALALGGGRLRAQTAPIALRASFGPTGIVYAANMVAIELGFAREEGLDIKLAVTDGGAKSRQVVAAGEAEFGHGDATHPLQLTNRGKPAKILLTTETIASYANIVIRQDLYEQGVTTPEKLGQWKRPDGAKPIIAATAIGSGTWMFGTAIFEQVGLGKNLNWVGGGGPTTMLGGLSTKQFDAIMALPSWQFQAEDKGWGKAIFDVSQPGLWDKTFGGAVPVSTIWALDETVAKTEQTQAYVNAIFRAMQWLKKSPVDEVYAKVGPKYIGDLDAGAVKREIAFYQKIWNFSGTTSEADFKRAAPVWYREGTDLQPIDFAKVVEPRFLANAAKKYG